jgi:hypothetical protein
MNSQNRLDIVRRLIEESSLGTEGASALRARTARHTVAAFDRLAVLSGRLGDAEPAGPDSDVACGPSRARREDGPRLGTGAGAP